VTHPQIRSPHDKPPRPASKPDHTERNVTIIGLVLLILGLASMATGPSVAPSSGPVSMLAGRLMMAVALT